MDGGEFTQRWLDYFSLHKIRFLKVSIYDSDIIRILKTNMVEILFAHLHHNDHKTSLIARSILLSIEKSGIKLFPNHDTFWHFDDKLSQKYILEAYNIPHAPMHVFYTKSSAKDWLSSAKFPLVFKLRNGAGSSNVILLKNLRNSKRYLNKMFSKGIKPVRNVFHDFNTKINKHRAKKELLEVLLRVPTTVRNIIIKNLSMHREKNYFLVQDFLPGNNFDTRVTVIGNKAFAFRRMNRSNDFKASGSGNIDYNINYIDRNAIVLSFHAAKLLGSQSMAFDILYNQENMPVIIEMSYVYDAEVVSSCGGYWDKSLRYHKESLRPEDLIIENVT